MKLGQTVLLQWDGKGNHLGTIVTPVQPAHLTWGDNDYRTLYITAITSVDRLETKTQGYVPYLEHQTAVRKERFSVRKRKAEHVASSANRDILHSVNTSPPAVVRVPPQEFPQPA